MSILTTIRTPIPVAEVAAPASAFPRSVTAADGTKSGPVSTPPMSDAVAQVPPKLASDPQMLMEPGAPAISAVAAAEAARHAYIEASIAAGISPLPLP